MGSEAILAVRGPAFQAGRRDVGEAGAAQVQSEDRSKIYVEI